MTDFDTLTGADALHEARRLRKARADELRLRRRRYAELRATISAQLVNMLIRSASKDGMLPWAPEHGTTVKRLRREALAALRYARSRIPNCQSEYFSACGMEDYYAELREDARREGVQLVGMYLAAKRETHSTATTGE